MLTTLDRYLLGRFWHVFLIAFVSLFGLYVVVDCFTNADDFLKTPGGPMAVAAEMARFYSYRISLMFDVLGGIVTVLASMVTFAILQRNGELNPILSAGIPTYRLIAPVLWGALIVDVGMACNREFVIPQIAHRLNMGAGLNKSLTGEVEPQYDRATLIALSAKQINLMKQTILDAEFVLPDPASGGQVAERIVTLHAKQAAYLGPQKNRRNGWLLKEVEEDYESLPLTAAGRKVVMKTSRPGEIFVVSDITLDQLSKGDKNHEMVSTWELLRRIRSPSYSKVSIRKLCLHLHSRITRPILDLLTVLLGLPLVVRKGQSLIANLAICAAALGSMFGLAQVFAYLGSANLIAPDLAAWAPVIATGTLSAWAKDEVKT